MVKSLDKVSIAADFGCQDLLLLDGQFYFVHFGSPLSRAPFLTIPSNHQKLDCFSEVFCSATSLPKTRFLVVCSYHPPDSKY